MATKERGKSGDLLKVKDRSFQNITKITWIAKPTTLCYSLQQRNYLNTLTRNFVTWYTQHWSWPIGNSISDPLQTCAFLPRPFNNKIWMTCNYTIKLYAVLGQPKRSLMHLRQNNNCLWELSCCPKWLDGAINGFIIICFSQCSSISARRWAPKCQCAEHELFAPTAGTISGEEVPIVSKTNIKEYRDSFSCEKFTFRSNPNITFYVYVSNFSWPIKIQVRTWTDSYEADDTSDLIFPLFCVQPCFSVAHKIDSMWIII